MIRYTLVCDKRHEFESWFASSAAYDRQAKRDLVTCPMCGSAKVEKALMTPRLARIDTATDRDDTATNQETVPAQPSPTEAAPDAAKTPTPVAMMSPQEREFRRKLRQLRDH